MELEIKNLIKRYGDKTALADVSLSLSPGIYGLLGANGAGKSTLMNIIVGNLDATEGEIFCDGVRTDKLGAAYRSKIGYMPQQQNLYPYFSGLEFLRYMAALKGLTSAQARETIPVIADKVNLTDVLRKKVGSYSGGMKQRLLLAQAVLGEPEIVVLDEPTAGLDPKERIHVRNLISEFALDRIVMIATHVVTDIEFISKEIIILKNGMVVEQGAPEELIASMEGKVFEIDADISELAAIQKEYRVSNINKTGSRVCVRVITDKPIHRTGVSKAAPNIEDKYLYVFEEEPGGDVNV